MKNFFGLSHRRPFLSNPVLRSKLYPLLFCAFSLGAGLSIAYAEDRAPTLSAKLTELVSSKEARATLGLEISDLGLDKPVFEENTAQLLVPASLLKLVTSSTALSVLGPEFRFSTRVWVGKDDPFTKTRSPGLWPQIGTLYIQGGGDPDLAIERAWLLVRKLKLQGLQKVGSVVLDDTLFINPPTSKGHRAFQTGVSALSFNFNSILFEICPRSPGKDALIKIDPLEVPMTISGKIKSSKSHSEFNIQEKTKVRSANSDKPLHYEASGSIAYFDECAKLYRSVSNPAYYFGLTFIKLLQNEGIAVQNRTLSFDKTPDDALLIAGQQSKSLRLILDDMNHYSNNFIAEQVLFALGFVGEKPFDASTQTAFVQANGSLNRSRGIQRLGEFMKSLGSSPQEFKFVDGSGIGHENRMSVRLLGRLLRYVHKNPRLAAEFESSLSLGGLSGTLKKRDFATSDSADTLVRGKTGTLDGVSSLAGYVLGKSGKKYAFAIIQNNIGSKEKATWFEDRLVQAIAAFG